MDANAIFDALRGIRWEYNSYTWDPDSFPRISWVSWLDVQGRQGWELISWEHSTDNTLSRVGLFKRVVGWMG